MAVYITTSEAAWKAAPSGVVIHTDIPTTTGGNLLWPGKTYFDGGTGQYQGMDNSYCFCITNHTGQASMGDEAYLLEGAGAPTVKGIRNQEGFLIGAFFIDG